MKKIYFHLSFLWCTVQLSAQPFSKLEIAGWEKQAGRVTVIRDNWGIPHIYGKTDADAVFGLLYAQCEDDFPRVEMNYIEKLGRSAEVKGESSLYDDLLIRMIIDSADALHDYNISPAWLKKLMNAYADGINYYLYKHPGVRPALLNRFKPWFPLLWTDGSIGAINTADITVKELENLYSGKPPVALIQNDKEEEMLTGSNGFAFSPKITASGHSILYINPHVTFYFRPEVHMVSEEGLNVYGAVTWGQFFVYQGFNEHGGWMHTSSKVDAADTYIEKITPKGKGFVYDYNKGERPVTEKYITIRYKTPEGIESKNIRTFHTHHGPVMAKRNDRYISLRADNRIMNGLIQCWLRDKTRSFAEFKKTLDLLGNISNNTVYADAEGNIAYWHGNRVPIRDPHFNWNDPVDGTSGATEWKGFHKVDETIHIINPPNGWLQNCNSTPYTVAGKNSPLKKNYPAYMAPDGENFRGLNAVRVLSEQKNYTLEKVIQAGYDSRLAAFEVLVPALVNAFEKNVKTTDSLYGLLTVAVDVLKNWDYRCGVESIPTGLAVEWGEKLLPAIQATRVSEEDENDIVIKTHAFISHAAPNDLLMPLLATVNDLMERNGCYQIPWGDFNRFQRITGEINNEFDDSIPSLPVGFTSSTWGMLPSYTSRVYPGTKKRYGVNGNSFMCVVEFGKKIVAKSLLAGGESGNPASPHFNDQAEIYTKGIFKDVYFYKGDVAAHREREYHPGKE